VVPGADRRLQQGGIVANRGVAVCDGKVFVLNIDMTITMLNQQTGEVIKRVPISSAVPAPQRATATPRRARHLRQAPGDHRCGGLRVRRARLRHGVQDERPVAGVGEPRVVDPALRDELAQGEPDRRRRRDVDTGDDRRQDEHGLLRHRFGDAALLPGLAARLGSAHRLADRGRPTHREAEVVAAADGP
jgi:hypothetical protein